MICFDRSIECRIDSESSFFLLLPALKIILIDLIKKKFEMNSVYYKKRWKIIFYCCDQSGPKLSYGEAAKQLRTSRSEVQRWVRRFNETGAVDDVPKCGRPRATNKADERAILNSINQKRPISAPKIQSKLKKKGKVVSLATIHRRLKENGVVFGSVMTKPLISDDHQRKRLKWAKENIDRDWSNVIFTDESTFTTFAYKKKVWRLKYSRPIVRTVKHPAKLHVWGCFSSYGFGELFCFVGNLNSEFLINIYENALLPSANKWFKQNEPWYLQEDNDPKHKSKMAEAWRIQHNVNRISWPANSPDCNPIENVWAILKERLKENTKLNVTSLAHHLLKEWKSLPSEFARKLAESCTRRCQAVINSNGDYTLY